jgi:hypothetical protein
MKLTSSVLTCGRYLRTGTQKGKGLGRNEGSKVQHRDDTDTHAHTHTRTYTHTRTTARVVPQLRLCNWLSNTPNVRVWHPNARVPRLCRRTNPVAVMCASACGCQQRNGPTTCRSRQKKKINKNANQWWDRIALQTQRRACAFHTVMDRHT